MINFHVKIIRLIRQRRGDGLSNRQCKCNAFKLLQALCKKMTSKEDVLRKRAYAFHEKNICDELKNSTVNHFNAPRSTLFDSLKRKEDGISSERP